METTYCHGTGYIDGIPVKIGEKFKPPIKITLPLNYQQRNPSDVLNEDYDFNLERRIVDFAEKKRKMKEEKERAKYEQVASRIEQFTRLGNDKYSDSSEGSPTGSGNVPSSGDSSECAQLDDGKIQATKESESTRFAHLTSNESGILTPETANQTTRSESPQQPPQNVIKLEDFEAESSPFDSVELKTLNDMEELKSVLQSIAPAKTNDISQAHLVTNEQYTNQYGHLNRNVQVNGVDNRNGAFSVCQQSFQQYPTCNTSTSYYDRLPTYSTYTMQWNLPDNVYRQMPQTNGAYCYTSTIATSTLESLPSLRAARSTPDLMSELDPEIQPVDSFSHLPRPNSVGSVQSFGSEIITPDPFDQLDEAGKTLARQMTDMGFPRTRTARAILKLGLDDKKVVEHLCCVQSMIESGFDAERAESALLLHNQDQKQAQNYLRLIKQFLDLGFEESAIERALKLHDYDRDKALDYLVS